MALIARLLSIAAILLMTASLAWAYPARVSTDLNLRTGAGTGFSVITVIPRGARVDVRACRGNWCAIMYRGLRGYVSARYLAPRRTGRVVVPPPMVGPPPAVIPTPPPQADACDARSARWAIGSPLTVGVIERARTTAHAQTVRVIRPGEFYTQEFNRHRLNLELNDQDIIVDVRCG
jgi:uncharacterized protein YraI